MGRKTYVVIHVLPTNMQQRARKVAVRHLQAIVQCPQGRAEAIANPRESTTRRGIGLEHQQRFIGRLGDVRRVQVWLYEALACGVSEIPREDILWIFGRVTDSKLRETVVIGVTRKERWLIARKCPPAERDEMPTVQQQLHRGRR